jgi:hypothetical protein
MKFIKLDKRYKGHSWGYNYAFELRKRDVVVRKIQDILHDMYGAARVYPEGEVSSFWSWDRNKHWFTAPIDGKKVRIYLKDEVDATMIVMQLPTENRQT